MKLRSFLTLLLCLSFCVPAQAQRRKLSVGDTAPGLDIEAWVKGADPTKMVSEKPVMVIEFWATWCGPCKKSIPHLTELQSDYEADGLRIVGVSQEEQDTVEKFVRRQGAKMDYAVAVDRRGLTSKAWMQAAGQRGIPCAFVVDRKNKLQFIGHPLSDEFEEILLKVLEGRYDEKLERQAKPHLEAAQKARRVKNWQLCSKHQDDVLALDDHVFARIMLEKFEILLLDRDDPEAAYAYAETLVERKVDDPEFLSWLAEMIARDPKIPTEKRNLDLAMAAAIAADENARRPGTPELLSVRALVHFERDEVEEAIDLQKEAWFNASPKRKAEYKRVLDEYRETRDRSERALSGLG